MRLWRYVASIMTPVLKGLVGTAYMRFFNIYIFLLLFQGLFVQSKF